MRKLSLLVIVAYLLTSMVVWASQSNDWIDYNAKYYTIKISSTGICRIDYNVLTSQIPNVSNIDKQNYALYYKGKRIPIYLSGKNNTLQPGDFIEFLGQKNDGELDTELYANPDWQTNPYQSSFSDISTYYLTVDASNNTDNGKYQLKDTTLMTDSNIPVTPFFTDRVLFFSTCFNPNVCFNRGNRFLNTNLYSPEYESGEGFTEDFRQFNTPKTIRTPHVYTGVGAPTPFFKTRFASITDFNHSINIRMNDNMLLDSTFSLNRMNVWQRTIPTSYLLESNTIKYTASAGGERNALGTIEIIYPRKFLFENASSYQLEISATQGTKNRLVIKDFNDQSSGIVVYDLTDGYRLQIPATSADSFNVILPESQSNQNKSIYVRAAASSVLIPITTIQAIQFENYLAEQADYIIITHSALSQGENSIMAYKTYRESPSGGSFNVKIVDIEQLYDQFAWGISKHPMSIRNFSNAMEATWTDLPKHLFLIGKGREYNRVRTNASSVQVPTFGHPGGDVLFTATKNRFTPRIPIARLSVSTPEEVSTYLNKVKDYERELNIFGDPYQTLKNKDWMKQIIHFGGGTTLNEQKQIRGFLELYRAQIEKQRYGATVYSDFKNNPEPISDARSEIIDRLLNRGTSLITFFGHSSAQGFGFNFNSPEEMNNRGKYPFIFSNGCFAGNIFQSAKGISERFVLSPDKGAIAFMATSDQSQASDLHSYASIFYKNLSSDFYGSSIAKIIQENLRDVEEHIMTLPAGIFTKIGASALSMTLNGDPAIRFNQYNKPDYAIEVSEVAFTPPIVTTSTDSFDIRVVITNLGAAVDERIKIQVVRRIVEDGETIPIIREIKAPFYKDTILITFPVLYKLSGRGINQFDIFVDSDEQIDELSETNNKLFGQVQNNILSNSVSAIHPCNYAIVSSSRPTLYASTANPLALSNTYHFEIDTSKNFNSPLKQKYSVVQTGGVISWTPSMAYLDSTVYYWRVGVDTLWENSSFVYIPNYPSGWNQSHYFQYTEDDFLNLELPEDRVFKFSSSVKEITVRTGLVNYLGGAMPESQMAYFIDGTRFYRWFNDCGIRHGLTFAIINPSTGLPISATNTQYTQYGNRNCTGERFQASRYGFRFPTTGNTPASHPTHPNTPWSEMIERLIDSVPDDHYILMFSHNNPNYTSWSTRLVNKLNDIGATGISNLVNGNLNAAYIYFGQKGNPNASQEFFGSNLITDQLDQNISFSATSSIQQATLTSPKIGPVLKWNNMSWRVRSQENPTQDQASIDVLGINSNGEERLIKSDIQSLDTTVDFIDATIYPYVKLRLRTSDMSDVRTPSQLVYWRVGFDPAPDLALDPSAYLTFQSDTVEQGQPLLIDVAVQNPTSQSFDSLTVKYSVLKNGAVTHVFYDKQDILKAQSSGRIAFSLNTAENRDIVGAHFLQVEVNPLDRDVQREKNRFNNHLILPFFVRKDNVNPLLDVTFDGRHIVDGDIVSSKPDIRISLRDENNFLALDDTSLVQIHLKYPNGDIENISYDDDMLTFIAPKQGAKNNTAQISFLPVLKQDGIYELIVRDKDRSGNSSRVGRDDEVDYRISFKVILKSSISNVLNYPNPFTSSTRFLFTLTGGDIPDYFKIQILTATGKIVREITQEEIGPIFVGQNLTQFAWDGTDRYGDPLGNGVYLYRVVSSINGQNIEHLESKADAFFTKGFGKMMLIR